MRILKYLAITSLMLGGCSTDEQPSQPHTVDMTVTAMMPSSGRAYADAGYATRLQYAVYVKGTDTPLAICSNGSQTNATTGVATLSGGSTTIGLSLVVGSEYDIVFWADTPDNSFYTFDAASHSVTVSYAGAIANDDTRDAFAGHLEVVPAKNVNLSVSLVRPLAQINFATTDATDATAAGLDFSTAKSKLTVAKLGGNVLDLITGNITSKDFDGTATFGAASLPDETLVGHSDKRYIGMAYVLTDRATADVTYQINSLSAQTYSEVAIAPNSRTNFTGPLLTTRSEIAVSVSADM